MLFLFKLMGGNNVMYRKEIIEVVILFIILIGIAYVAFSGFFGDEITEFKAMALATEHVKKEYNLSSSQVSVLNSSLITFKGQKGYNVTVFFQEGNTTHNVSYLVNTNNGSLTTIFNKTT